MSSLSIRQREILCTVAPRLSRVPGVVAVVLGGSHAHGTARPDSDLDVGLYYHESLEPEIKAIRSIAEDISIAGRPPTITECYQWGPWVNGGGWIQTSVGKVDILYRNIEQVERVIGESKNGIYHHHFFQQPTFGFTSIIYLAETHSCVPLFDPENRIAALKSEVQHFPGPLRSKLINDSLFIAEFTLVHAQRFAARNDAFNCLGCVARVGYFLVQALFALNTRYYFGDKGAFEVVAQFEIQPPGFASRMGEILRSSAADAKELGQAVELTSELWSETVRLTGGAYSPSFDIS